MTVEPRSVTAFIGPSGCGKSTFLRTLNRMHEVIPGGRVEGKVMLDDQDLYASSMDPVDGAPHGRHGLPAAEPLPDDVDLRQRRGGPAAQRREEQEDARRASSSGRCKGANLWNEVKDRLDQAGCGALRWPAAAPVHRPRDRRAAAGAAHGRAVLGPRPDLDAGHRGPRSTSSRTTTRSSSSRTTCSRPRGSPTARRSSTSRPPGEPGRLVEIDDTTRIFNNPTEQATEDYISGRFG